MMQLKRIFFISDIIFFVCVCACACICMCAYIFARVCICVTYVITCRQQFFSMCVCLQMCVCDYIINFFFKSLVSYVTSHKTSHVTLKFLKSIYSWLQKSQMQQIQIQLFWSQSKADFRNSTFLKSVKSWLQKCITETKNKKGTLDIKKIKSKKDRSANGKSHILLDK